MSLCLTLLLIYSISSGWDIVIAPSCLLRITTNAQGHLKITSRFVVSCSLSHTPSDPPTTTTNAHGTCNHLGRILLLLLFRYRQAGKEEELHSLSQQRKGQHRNQCPILLVTRFFVYLSMPIVIYNLFFLKHFSSNFKPNYYQFVAHFPIPTRRSINISFIFSRTYYVRRSNSNQFKIKKWNVKV